MEKSNYQDFLDCLKPIETVSRAMITGAVMLEKMQLCDELGIPYEKINLDAVTREADRHYALMHGGLYAVAMLEWAETYYSRQTMEQTEAAAEDGGCNSIHNNNSS